MKISDVSKEELMLEIQKQSGRFFSHIQKTESCWIWMARKDKDGYGKFAVTFPRVRGEKQNQIHFQAHRFSHILST